ncbi:histone-like nucleoid-structuring protein Lsr2 [Nocardia tengchongensis]|uniref:histone-like nucleoid-structuring protein Lsr2 n=1 Tax=Nocardia tengchongensis TaxID=2055889 RepID=UPI0036C53CF4
MAKKVTVTLICDRDRESPAARTIVFGAFGKMFEIDLAEEAAAELTSDLEYWTQFAREIPAKGNRTPAPRGSATEKKRRDREENDRIRNWGRNAGHQVSSRGKIPTEIVEGYKRAAS